MPFVRDFKMMAKNFLFDFGLMSITNGFFHYIYRQYQIHQITMRMEASRSFGACHIGVRFYSLGMQYVNLFTSFMNFSF